MENQQRNRIRIKDIALLAGVSEGTVDRVIHKRGDVSIQSMEAVNKALKELNYSPNLFARSLASKKQYRFACIIPTYKAGDYWDGVANSFDCAAINFENYNVFIDKKYFDQLDASSFTEVAETILSQLPDGVILSPIFRAETLDFISKLSEHHIPFSFFDSMIENTTFLTYYGQNSFQSGYVAAKLLLENCPEQAEILIIRTQRKKDGFSNQTVKRYKGFINYIENCCLKENLKLIDVWLSDNDETNLQLLEEIFFKHKSIKSAIAFNSKVYRLAVCLEAMKQTEIRVLGYDLLEKNVNYLKQGLISYLIAQRPEKQVYCSVRDMCRELIFKQTVTKINYVPIDILMKENIDYYTEFEE
ncbi:MAG: LacI family DNA-binding transcriptional regulator [Dysgonamonadaceae bacterium]|jgi:LacI family transcriptional regulator|nr:LacI family DNA-binding transcriptional regulator [Dysgonamonadaceae bacterium]